MTSRRSTTPRPARANGGGPDPAERLRAAYEKATRLHKAGRLAEAEQGYRAVARAAPKLSEPHYQLGRIARARGDAAAALDAFDAALARKPGEAAILSARAEALGAAGRMEEALAAYDALIKAAPREIKPRADKALLLQRTGDFDAAEAELRRALKRAPRDGELYRMLVQTRKVRRGEPLLKDMLRAHAEPGLPSAARMQLDFALAKAMADIGEHGLVFTHLNAANAAMRARQPWDAEARRAEVDGLIAAFEGADFTPIAEPPAGPRPIFVTGLPRSGTTLVEQILAAHGDVTGGGERRFVLEEAYRVMGDPARGFTPLREVPDGRLAEFGTAYLAALSKAVPAAGAITDKSIQSHLVLGLIAKALPQARMIVVRRDPRDLGLSIYRNLFAPGTHRYAYDMADIAAYVASFERIMAFWREAIPGRFTEVSYEALVAEPEAQTRALVAAAGLDWDAACLSFHTAERQVATLSIQQVPQPMHGGA